MSNMIKSSDNNYTTIYDIPCILKSYYDSITDKKKFELEILQSLMSNIDFVGTRMLTDFTNIKFPNTSGTLSNMKKNKVNKLPVIDFIPKEPQNPNTNDRYIVASPANGLFYGNDNKYAQCIDGLNNKWFFSNPTTDDIVYVQNKFNKYIFNGISWYLPEFTIPLKISLEVFRRDDYFGTDMELSTLVKTTLIERFSNQFLF